MGRETRSHHYRRTGSTAREVRPPSASLGLASGTFARASSATRRTAQGSLESVGSNVLRLEDRGDGGAPGYLLEGAFTNEVTDSENMSAWAGPSPATVTDDTSAAPDGTTTADNVDDTAVGAAQQRVMSMTGLSLAAHQFYIWCRKDSDETRFPALVSGNPFTITQWNTKTGATNERVGVSASNVEDWDDFWRLEINVTLLAASNSITIRAADGSVWGAFSAAATGSEELWGAQMTENVFPRSYMPASGGAATKAADELKFPAASTPAWVSSGKSRILVSPYWTEAELSAGGSILGWDANNQILWVHATGELRWMVNGVNVGALTGITFARHTWLTVDTDFVSRQATLAGASAGNGSVALTGSDTWPTSGDLFVGCLGAGVSHADGRYQDIQQL